MTEERILEWLDKNNRGFTQKDFELFKKFYKETTKEDEIHTKGEVKIQKKPPRTRRLD